MKNKSENFYVNGVYIASFWYDFAKEKLLLYTVDGHLEAEIAMGNKQYNQLYKENPNPSGEGSVWNKLVELFGDILFQGDADSLFCDELFPLRYGFGRTVSQHFQLIIRLTD